MIVFNIIELEKLSGWVSAVQCFIDFFFIYLKTVYLGKLWKVLYLVV